jgi:hypothetical protein
MGCAFRTNDISGVSWLFPQHFGQAYHESFNIMWGAVRKLRIYGSHGSHVHSYATPCRKFRARGDEIGQHGVVAVTASRIL